MKKTSQSSDEKSVGFKLPGYWTFFRDVTARRSVRDIRESLGSNSTAKTPVDIVTNGSISPEVEIKALNKEPSSELDDKSLSKLETAGTTHVEEDTKPDDSSVVLTGLQTIQIVPEVPSNSGITHDVQTGIAYQEKSVNPGIGKKRIASEIVPDDVFWTEEEERLRNNSTLEEHKQENTEGLAQSETNGSSDTLVASENEIAQEILDRSQNRIENLQQNLATQIRPETVEVYKDSIAKNTVPPQIVEQKRESKSLAKAVNNIASHSVDQKQESKAPEKPARVSWTTRLLQKLTEEEENKKKIRQEPKLQKPKRIVRFPQKKPPKAEKKEWPKFYPGVKKPEAQTGQTENVSGIKLDTKDKDAYASLITQLSDPKEEEKKDNTKSVEVKDEARLQKVEEIRAAIAREECVTSSDDDSLVDMKEKPTGIRRLLPQNLFSRREEYERPVLEPLLKRGDRVHPARPVHETAFLSRSQSSSPARDNEHNSSRSKSMSPARDRKTLPDPARSNRTVPDAPKDAYYHSPPSRRKTSEASSASSTSTLVADNWNPLHVNLEYQAISGSPDIRRLQQQKQYGEIRRNDSQGQVPSGRLSAPPYQCNAYPKRRVTTPEPPRSSRRSLSQPPRQRNSLQVLPVGAQVKIMSSSCDVNCKETQTNKSYIQQASRQPQVKPIQHPQNKQVPPGQYQNKQYRSSPAELNVSLSPVNRKYQHSPSGNRAKDSPSQIDYPNNPSQTQRSLSPTSVNRQYSPERRPDDLKSHYQNIPAQYQRTLSPADSLNMHRGSQQIPPQLDRSLSPLRYQSSPALQRSLSPADSLNRQQYNRSGSQQLQNKHSPQQLDRSLSPIRYQNSPSQLHRSLSPADSLHRQQHNRSGSELQHQKRSPQHLDRSLSPVRYKNNQEQLQRGISPTNSLNRQGQLHRSISPADSLNRQQHNRPGTQNLQHQKPSPQQLDRSLSPVRYQNSQTQLQRSLSPAESLTKQQISPRRLARNDNQMTNRQYQNSPVQFIPRQYMNSPAQLSPQRLYQSSPALQVNLPPEDFNRQFYGGPEQMSTESLNRQYQKIPGQHTTDSLNRNLQNSPTDARQSRQFKKLSRQEVEALYWETQRLRAGLSSLSQQFNMSTTSLQTPPTPRPPYRVNSAQNVGNVYGTVLVKPQPVTPRARSVSPSPDRHLNTRSLSLPRDTNFSRGTPTRNTIGPIRTQPPIYEESEEVLLRHGNKGSKKKSNYAPIFKRGSLTCPIEDPGPSPYPKRVSFTSSGEQLYWPTRNGPAIEPPTRQRKGTTDSEEYSTYANIPATMTAPNRPLPPVPKDVVTSSAQRWQQQSESESGSEAGEVQRILQQGYHGRGSYFRFPEEEWGADGKSRGTSGTEQSASNVGRDDEVRRSGGGGGRSGRRDEPRRHTLSGDHHHHQQGGALARSMDLESPLPRGYPPPSSAMLFDEDPGIMSEVETSSTGFRRGGKQRSSLPVVRTPSKTLERPLGLVFLQYRNETKRALLPNEITSIDTVKALFVRSFPKQLTMEYLDSPHVKIYIHDSSKDMFYELEDLRSHLRDIRDRSVLRLFESTDMNGGVLPGAGVGVVAPPMWDQDQSYFSEPEFDSEYQHQHIHKTKASSKSGSSGVPPQAPYYMTHSYPPGGATGAPGASATLPRGGPLLRAYSPAVAPPVPSDRIKTLPQTDRLHAESGYMSSPERGGPRAYPAAYPPGGPGYEDPYYSQYASRSGSITPVIDEEARIRVEHMERQLANLTGLVQKALTQTPTPREYLQVPPPASARDTNYRNGV